jgi:hypothetical protein
VKVPSGYERGAQLTFLLVREWLGKVVERPRFAFPPKDIALIADLRDIGEKLARNDSARELVAHLIECVVNVTGNAPTAMMLRVVLEQLDCAVEYVAPSDLGLAVPKA